MKREKINDRIDIKSDKVFRWKIIITENGYKRCNSRDISNDITC